MILDAFERCIVRSGFHRTTMQDVATEAAMSAGNLYRYFDSKEALVLGLAERDRDRMRTDFVAAESAPDILEAMNALGRKHFVEEPRERAVQVVEIWAEAMHNPKIAAMYLTIESDCTAHMLRVLEKAKASGQIHSNVDTYKLAKLMMILGDGVFLRRAIDKTYDAEAGMHLIFSALNPFLFGNAELSDQKPASSPNKTDQIS